MSAVMPAGSPAADFELVSHWHLAAPAAPVWRALNAPQEWPRWWRYVRSVEKLCEGEASGNGSVHRIEWSSRLPYSLTFDVETVEVVPERLLRGRARGQLNGTGTWALRSDGGSTHVSYVWAVDLGQPWMRRIAPIAAPVFRWNHGAVMRAGAVGLAEHLGTALLGNDGGTVL